MKQDNSTSPQIIQNEKAASLLIDTEQLKLISPFMAKERNISQVAKELDMAIDAMTYRVKRFLKLGILKETRKEARKGRAISYYQAANAFFIPLQNIPKLTTEELLEQANLNPSRQISKNMTKALYEDAPFQNWGVLLQYQESGQTQIGLAPPDGNWDFSSLLSPDAPAILSSWMPLRLDYIEAKRLQAELFELIAKYSQKQGSQNYLLGLSLAPVEGK